MRPTRRSARTPDAVHSQPHLIAALSDAAIEAGLRRQRRRTALAVFALSQLFGIGLLVAVRVLDVPSADAGTLLLGEIASLACGALIAAVVHVNLGHSLQR